MDYSVSSSNSTTDQATESRDVGNVSKVKLSCDGNLTISISSAPTLTVQAPAVWMPYIQTITNGNTLTLAVQQPENPPETPFSAEFALTTGKVKELGLTSGTATAASLNSYTLSLNASGGSKIALTDQELLFLNTTLSGSASCELSGECYWQDIDLSGSAHFYGFDLEGYSVEIGASASAEGQVNARRKLKSTTSGSALVVYKGDPKVDAEHSGSSRTIPYSEWQRS